MGKNQGFRCEKCKTRIVGAKKTIVPLERGLQTGLYFAACSSQRHLTKPQRRYGQEKQNLAIKSLIDGWHSFSVN
jgi:tRNA(Ile2) C34 agmatinyltransferase TiaS